MKPLLIVQTTFDDGKEAAAMAKKVVGERLAACAQLQEGVQSFYWWQGEIEQSGEYILSMKTTPEKFQALQQFVDEHHSYDTPEIIAFEIEHVSPDYLQWLRDETRS